MLYAVCWVLGTHWVRRELHEEGSLRGVILSVCVRCIGRAGLGKGGPNYINNIDKNNIDIDISIDVAAFINILVILVVLVVLGLGLVICVSCVLRWEGSRGVHP